MTTTSPPRHRTPRARTSVAALIVFGPLAVAGSVSATTVPPDSEGAVIVSIDMTDEGCAPDATEFAAGPLTFEISNVSATGVTEFEVLDGDRILAEKENLPPGFNGEFSLALGPGTYTLYCPGAADERNDITLTGTATTIAESDVAGVLQEGADGYLGYVQNQVDELVIGVGRLDEAIGTGDVEAARLAYINARPFYERIEPVAESFVFEGRNLDAAIDLRADDVAPTDLTGFHRIEYGLWIDESTDGLGDISAMLVADVASLHELVDEIDGFQPAELANGAVGLLDEAANGKITGEEQRYSRVDLVDLAANVEGAEQAFAYLSDGLALIDPDLVATIEARFDDLHAELATMESSDDVSGYLRYDELSAAQVTALSQALQAVAEPLSNVASKVVDA